MGSTGDPRSFSHLTRLLRPPEHAQCIKMRPLSSVAVRSLELGIKFDVHLEMAFILFRNVLLVALDDLDLEFLLLAVVGHSMRALGRI